MTAFVTGITGAGSFRLALALLVFVHHTTRVSLGMTAVYVFFELSGFWICTMWNGRYAKASFPYGVYLVSRAWRLMPVFILSAIVAWSVVYFQGVPVPNFNWVHRAISNIFILGYSSLWFQPNRPAWTLDVEMQFYLIAPLLILLMRSRALWVLAGCVVVSLIGYFVDYPYAAPPYPFAQTPHPSTVFPYLLFFAVGVAAASTNWRPSSDRRVGGFGRHRRGHLVLCRHAAAGSDHRRRSSGAALSPVQRGCQRHRGARAGAVGDVHDAAKGRPLRRNAWRSFLHRLPAPLADIECPEPGPRLDFASRLGRGGGACGGDDRVGRRLAGGRSAAQPGTIAMGRPPVGAAVQLAWRSDRAAGGVRSPKVRAKIGGMA